MNTNDTAVEKTKLVINALDYASTHKLDINKKEDVKKILDILDPKHVTDAEINEFMKLLQNADTFLEMSARKKNKAIKLPN